MPTHRRTLLLPILLLSTLALAACGGDDSADTTTTAKDGSSTTAAASGTTGGTATVAVAETDLGKVLVDAKGMTLYAFTPDGDGVSNCTDACATTWPPAAASGTPSGDGTTATLTVVARDDGSDQVAIAGHPLYTYVGDSGAGQTNGQGSGGKWFVVSADGSLIKDPSGGSDGATTTTSSQRSGY